MAVEAADELVPANLGEVGLVLVVGVDLAKGAAGRALAGHGAGGAGAAVGARGAGKGAGVGGEGLDVADVALGQLVAGGVEAGVDGDDLVVAVAGVVGTGADGDL